MKFIKDRYKMNVLLTKIHTMWNNNQTVESLNLTNKDLRTLHLLEEAECIVCRYPMQSNFPYWIARGSKSEIYFTQRSELWANRIFGFIVGILTTVLSAWIISSFGIK